MRLVQPKIKTETFGKNSFRYKGAKIWNDLPHEIKVIPTFTKFKSALEKWPGPSCICGSCILCKINQS